MSSYAEPLTATVPARAAGLPALAQGAQHADRLFVHRAEFHRLCRLHARADRVRLRPGVHALGRLQPDSVRGAGQFLAALLGQGVPGGLLEHDHLHRLRGAVTLVCSLGLAILLNQKIFGRNFFRTVAFFPYVASLVAVAVVWNMLFNPDFGPVNMVLYTLGVDPQHLPGWAADRHWAMATSSCSPSGRTWGTSW